MTGLIDELDLTVADNDGFMSAHAFDDLAVGLHRIAQDIATVMMVAAYVSEAARAERYARAALAGYDRELAPLMEQLRARLARPNPFAEPSRACGDRP